MVQAPSSQVAPLPSKLPFRIVSNTIGSGAYAFLRKAAPLNDDNPVVAVKFINKAHAFNVGRLRPKQLQNEILLHKHLKQHKNVIEFYNAGDDENWVWVAMELAAGGDLFDKIEADVGVGEKIAHFYFTQLINAISYMHSRGVAHRDIKPENVLLSSSGNLKLADFGLASLFEHKGQIKYSKSVVGSPPYMAPEIVASAQKSSPGYRPNISDIWSCGIVLFVLLAGNTPWDEPTGRSYEFKDFVAGDGRGNVKDDELWARIPHDTLSLLHGMLKLDPATRFSLDNIRTHPWFTQKNEHLNSAGQVVDSVKLATQLMENLRIDFQNKPKTAPKSVQRSKSNPLDAMEVDTPPNPTFDSLTPDLCHELDALKVAATQPEAPMAESLWDDWEPRAYRQPNVSASQAVFSRGPGAQLSWETQSYLAEDVTFFQFSQTPAVPLSLTQVARKFNDIMPATTMSSFKSTLHLPLLSERISNALHLLGIQSKVVKREGPSGGRPSAFIQVATRDGRGQGIKGTIVMEAHGSELHEVRFIKAKGDPLEWRRFFKRVCVHCAEDTILKDDRTKNDDQMM